MAIVTIPRFLIFVVCSRVSRSGKGRRGVRCSARIGRRSRTTSTRTSPAGCRTTDSSAGSGGHLAAVDAVTAATPAAAAIPKRYYHIYIVFIFQILIVWWINFFRQGKTAHWTRAGAILPSATPRDCTNLPLGAPLVTSRQVAPVNPWECHGQVQRRPWRHQHNQQPRVSNRRFTMCRWITEPKLTQDRRVAMCVTFPSWWKDVTNPCYPKWSKKIIRARPIRRKKLYPCPSIHHTQHSRYHT